MLFSASYMLWDELDFSLEEETFSQSSHSDEDDFSLFLSEDEEMEDEDSSFVSIEEEDKSSGSAMYSELLQASINSPTNRHGERFRNMISSFLFNIYKKMGKR